MAAYSRPPNHIDEIDGLRALAVLAVLLFHVEIHGLGGGFVGVDVFFVISGFLITRLILREIDATGRFNFVRFYTRRTRRLMPALFATIAATMLLAEFILPKYFAEKSAASALFAIVSLSNFYFWRQSGYFDDDSDTKPLLHTWSLSVEEQFYLLWPALILLVTTRISGAWRIVLLLLGFAASVVYSVRLGASSASFFLLPTRAHEFIIGALLVQLPKFPRHRLLLADSLTALGIAGIVIATLMFSDRTPFPSLNALAPCLAAAILIHVSPASRLGGILRSAPAKWLGANSYSLYLVHWPVVIFWKALVLGPLTPLDQAGMVLVSVALAAILHRAIETPLRSSGERSTGLSDRWFLRGCAGAATVLLIYSGAIAAGVGPRVVIGRAQTTAIALSPRDIELQSPCAYRVPETGPLDAADLALIRSKLTSCSNSIGGAIIVAGDSHATDVFNAIAHARPNAHVIGLTRAGCRVDGVGSEPRAGCQYDFLERLIADDSGLIQRLVYVQKGSYLLTSYRTLPTNMQAVQSVLGRLATWGSRVSTVWLGPHNELDIVPTKVAERGAEWVRSMYQRENRDIVALDLEVRDAAMVRGVEYVSAIVAVGFDFRRDIIVDGIFTYSDRDHWSAHGERILGRRLISNSRLLD
ncbi:MAG: acyltransferase family protein [Hyphomicrobiaceae bacterium]|nr:acyltransferase family protein [Hyphomicrobiaceae bacterium]